MPVVAVGLAVYAGATIATVGVAAMSTFAIIGSIGAITAGVGAVTGNKDLMKVGAVMGIVGGVGALATSAGAMGTTGAETAAAGGTADAGAAGPVAEQTMQSATPAPAAEVVNVPAGAGDTVANASTAVAPEVAAAATGTVDAAAAATTPGIVNTAVPPVTTAPVAEVSFFDAVKDYTKPMADFASKNQLLTYGMLQVGGGFMQGLFKEPTEIETAQSELLRQRAANMAAPAPKATLAQRRPVYGSTSRPVYAAPGLINQTVTGVPA